MERKLRGLFLNTVKANCSIYESGKMCYDCLILSDKYTLDYQEINEKSRRISLEYDFYIFNYHISTMGWLNTKLIKGLPGLKTTVVLEVLPQNPFVMCPEHDFDAYMVLDPTLKSGNAKVFTFPRPLESPQINVKYNEKSIPEFGTFGFATDGKGFDKVIDAVNLEFDDAIVKINIPESTYVSNEKHKQLINYLQNYPTKERVKVVITTDYFEKEELIKWCSQNTINVFLYNRNIQGLSATTDQAIVSGRPLAISTDNTFRHIHKYVKPYPFQNLKNTIITGASEVLKIQEDWAPMNFALRFESLLKDFNLEVTQKSNETYLLPKKNYWTNKIIAVRALRKSDFTPPIIEKIYLKYLNNIKGKYSKDDSKVAKPFVHYILQSFSQFNEDLIIDMLLGQKKNGIYVDIGAIEPNFNNNTQRFYKRGWSGINIEPDLKMFEKIKYSRPKDISLNMTISETTSLEMILDKNLKSNVFDFMSVNINRYDLTVLKSNNWIKYRPTVLMIENNDDFSTIYSFMDQKNYLHVFSNDFNMVFIDKITMDPSLLNNVSWTD